MGYTSLCSLMEHPNNTADQLFNDLRKINRGHSNEKGALILILFSKPPKSYLVAKINY